MFLHAPRKRTTSHTADTGNVVFCDASPAEQRQFTVLSYGMFVGVTSVFWLVGALLIQHAMLAELALLTLGAYAIVYGIRVGETLPVVPGGVLSGMAVGFLLTHDPFTVVTGDAAVALFLFCCALGWLLIIPVARQYARCDVVWPVIPGGMLALTSLLILL